MIQITFDHIAFQINYFFSNLSCRINIFTLAFDTNNLKSIINELPDQSCMNI